MRVGTVARRHLHVVHPLRAQPVHLMGCNRLQIILLDAGSNSRRDLVECGIDDGSTVFQAHDLVFVLDCPGILHDALAIGDGVSFLEHCENDLRFHDVDADADFLFVQFVIVEHHVEVFEETFVALPFHR
jgi:hypothetical protein